MTAVRTFEVLCGWIDSAKTHDDLNVICDYIEKVYIPKYPNSANVLHGQLVESMMQKIKVKYLSPETTDIFTQTTD